MKQLVELVEKQEKHFLHGGKLEKFYPAFEAFQSLLYKPNYVTKSSAHVRDNLDTKRYMSIVITALIPCLLFGIYNAGYQTQKAAGLALDLMSVITQGLLIVIPLVMVSYGVGLTIEFICAVVRRHEINEGFLVTGMLYALILPPTIPLWQAALGITFGVVIGKEVFGGTGRNFLNPALTGRIFLFFTFPTKLSGEVWTKLTVAKDQLIDGYSGATALAVAATADKAQPIQSVMAEAGYTVKDLFIGLVPGSIGETSVICVLMGAALLLITRIGNYRTMLGGLIGAITMSWILNMVAGPQTSAFFDLSVSWQLCAGSFAFAIVFMATDPVSSPALDASKWVYGFLIGVFGIIIRTINPAYPEGWMLAIILMNIFAPLIDHVFLQQRLKKRIPNVI